MLVLNSGAQNIYNSSGRSNARKPAKKSGFNTDKLVLGGDFRFSFGQGLSVGVAPMVGYQLVDNFFMGVRLGYSYSMFRENFNGILPNGKSTFNFNSNDYSGSIWARYLVFQSFYIHVEAEFNSYKAWYGNWDYDKNKFYSERLTAPSVLVGVGFRQPITDRVSLNTTILYDVLQDPYSYYLNRGGFDYRFGILVGF